MLHDPVEPVVQLEADKAPPVVVKDMVTPCRLFDVCAVIVEVVVESAGTEVGLADSETDGTVRVVVPAE
jgi:hypothetical protein